MSADRSRSKTWATPRRAPASTLSRKERGRAPVSLPPGLGPKRGLLLPRGDRRDELLHRLLGRVGAVELGSDDVVERVLDRGARRMAMCHGAEQRAFGHRLLDVGDAFLAAIIEGGV